MSFGDLNFVLKAVAGNIDKINEKSDKLAASAGAIKGVATAITEANAAMIRWQDSLGPQEDLVKKVEQLGQAVQAVLPDAVRSFDSLHLKVITTAATVKEQAGIIKGDATSAQQHVERAMTASDRALVSVANDPRFGGYVERIITLMTQLHGDKAWNNPFLAEYLQKNISMGKDILRDFTPEGRNIDWASVEQQIIDAAAAAKRGKILGKTPTKSTGSAGASTSTDKCDGLNILNGIVSGSI